MPKIFKPQNVVSIAEPVIIPDYTPPVIEIPEVEINDENAKLQYDLMIERAKNQAQEAADMITRSAELQKEEILKNAQAESEKIIESANERSRTIIQNAIKQSEKIKKDAYDEATQKAIEDKTAEVDKIISDLQELLEEMKAAQLDYFERYAVEMKMLSLDIAEKVLMSKVEEDELLMLDLISKKIKSIRDADWITIEISNKLPQLAEALEQAMKNVGLDNKTEIQPVSTRSKASCKLKASDRVVDISLKTQLKNIRAYFEKCDETDD